MSSIPAAILLLNDQEKKDQEETYPFSVVAGLLFIFIILFIVGSFIMYMQGYTDGKQEVLDEQSRKESIAFWKQFQNQNAFRTIQYVRIQENSASGSEKK